MSFVKLKHLYEQPIFAPVNGLESFAGFHGLGVQHNRIWTPEPEKLLKVIPERYHKDFKLTRMSINSVLIPHVDNDLITTINFYFQPENYRTIFYKAKPNASSWKTEEKQLQKLDEMKGSDIPFEELKVSLKEYIKDKKNMPTVEEISYVDAVYSYEDVYETGSFVANANEAYLLDVREIHNVEPLNGPKLRKAFALRTTKYDYREVYEMLEETGNL
jgi:hypothetical protein